MKKNIKLASLVTSIIAIVVTFTMLIGTTFAWFTDSVTSSGNKIQAGNLKVDLSILDSQGEWKSLKNDKAPIFDYDKWEPGYTDVKVLRVENEGSLALQWKASFVSENELSALADVIDVYVLPSEQQLSYPASRDLDGYTLVGTVRDFVNTIEATTNGVLTAGEQAYLGIALKMRTTAGNEYQGLDLGGAFDITIYATQLSYEEDVFDNDYDSEAKYATPIDTAEAFFNAVEAGDDVKLTKSLKIDEEFVALAKEKQESASTYSARINFSAYNDTVVIDTNAIVDGKGITVYRTAETMDKNLFEVKEGYSLTLSNITIDGGANWVGDKHPALLRGIVNNGMKTSSALVNLGANAALVLNEGAVLQNNDGANAVNLGTRTGGTLTMNGGEIINNHSAAGAIWGGGAITINSGKVNGNHGGIGGAIRIVTNIGTVLTMNGGEMNHNLSEGVGGAIWAGSSRSNNVYVLNGGEMAYNHSNEAGGAMYVGYYETVKMGGDFKMHHNTAPSFSAIRFHDHASFVMTGGEIYENGENSIFLNNNSASITGGTISDSFIYHGGLGLTLGMTNLDCVVTYNLGTNHNTAYLAKEFNTFRFIVNAEAANFSLFNFKPASDYVYTQGDEDKLVCLNEGYSMCWDETSKTFKLQANA